MKNWNIPDLLFAAVLCTPLAPVAHARTIDSLVFTEQSPTVLTETLDGSPIGNWVYQGAWYSEPPANSYWF
jgi:hypothetical protein